MGALIIIIALSFFSWQPLFNPGFFTFHDEQQVARLFQLDIALSAGQFPVRTVADLGFGLGYALFNFYPPLTYYFGEVFHLLGFGLIDSVKLVWLFAIVGSGMAMYFLAKKFFGKTGGVVSALFYIYAPYHAVDAYVRGALAELSSFVWLPLILLYSSRPVISGIFLALLMVTHNLIFLPFIGFYILWSRNIKNIIISLLIAFGLTAFFWAPALWEKQFTLVDSLLIKNLASYKIHFVCPTQLWDSLWGYGGSIPGCLDGMSFKLGKLHIILGILAFIPALKSRSKVVITSFFLFVFSVFMTTSYSGFIWDRVQALWYLQFPWRFLEFAALFSALLVGSVTTFKNKWLNGIVAVGVIGPLLFFNGKLFQPQTYLKVTDSDLTTDDEVKWRVSSTSFEYLPKGVATKTNPNGTLGIDIEKQAIYEAKYQIIDGEFQEFYAKFYPHRFELSGISTQGAIVRVRIANFPGWKVRVNEKPVKIDDNNPYKLVTFMVPEGEVSVRGVFSDTPVRTIGNIISLVTVFGVGLYGYKRIKK